MIAALDVYEKRVFFRGAAASSGSGPPHYRAFTIADTPHTVGLLWTRDRPVAETST
jgi:hypothetical protein